MEILTRTGAERSWKQETPHFALPKSCAHCSLHKHRHCTMEAIVKIVKHQVEVLIGDESLLLTAPLLLKFPLLPPHLLALSGLVQSCQHCLPIPAAAGVHL